MIYLILFLVVLSGGLLAFYLRDLDSQYVKLLLSFSGAYLLSVIVFHLLPDIYVELNGKTAGVLIMSGIVFQLFLELFSHGAEHGHRLIFNRKVPWLLWTSLAIHAFMEGLPINQGHHLHTSYFYGILIHKLPIAVLLTTVMIEAGMSKTKIIGLLTVFALMSPSAVFLSNHIEFITTYAAYINAFVVGILAHIGTTILFENEHSHRFNIRKFLLIFLAMFLAYLT